MRVTVTAEDIAAGSPAEACACPIALTLMRAAGAPRASVGDESLGAVVKGNWRWWPTPGEVVCFVARFDAGLPVKPFEFELPEAA